MTELVVRESELTDRGGRVASADHRETLHLGERLGDGLGTGREWRKLEHSHRTVPEDGARRTDDVGEAGRGVRADIQAETARSPRRVFDRVGGAHLVLRVRTELRCNHDVGRDHDLHAEFFGLRQVALHVVDLVLLQQARPHSMAEGREEGEEHATTDQQDVDLGEQRADHVQLVRDLRAAEHHHIGLPRRHGEPLEDPELLLDEKARRARQLLGQFVDAGLLAMDHPESVGDERVTESRQLAGEIPAVAVILRGLVSMEPEVLQERDVAIPEPAHGILGRFADRVMPEHHGPAQKLAKANGDRLETVLEVAVPIRPAEMRDHHDLRTHADESVQGRQRGADASVVGDRAVFERYVQVAADDHRPAFERTERIDRAKSHQRVA